MKSVVLSGLMLLIQSSLLFGQFVFEKELVEVRAPEDADSVDALYSFKIQGDKELEIDRLDVYCSCLKAQISDKGKLKWKPGETGQIKATFSKIGMFKGTVDKKLAIFLKGDPADQPSISLTFRLHIPVLMEISQKTLRWNLKGDATAQTVDFIVKGKDPMKVMRHYGTKELFAYELETVKEGRHYKPLMVFCDSKRIARSRAMPIIRSSV